MDNKFTFLFLPVLNMISASNFDPTIRDLAAFLTIIIAIRQIIKGVRKEGSCLLYIKSFFKKNK